MNDSLLGDDRFMSLCMATIGNKKAERRLGSRVYNEQFRYSEYIKGSDIIEREINRIALIGEKHYNEERKMSIAAKSVERIVAPNEVQGNTYVYELMNKVFEVSKRVKKNSPGYKEEVGYWEKSFISGLNRSGSQFTLSEQVKYMEDVKEIIVDISKISLTEVNLEKLNFKRVEEHNRAIKESRLSSGGKIDTKYKMPKRDRSYVIDGIDEMVIGELRAFTFHGKAILLTSTHYTRLMNYLIALRNIMIIKKDIETPLSPFGISEVIKEACYNIARADSNFIGECMKGARQLVMVSLERSHIIGNPVSMYSETLEKERLLKAEELISAFSAITGSKLILINLLGFYTCLPHPDAPIKDMFSKIDGVKEPNKVKSEMLRRFEGKIRRNLYHSMRRSGHDVRLKAIDPLSSELVKKANDATQTLTGVLNFPSSIWRYTEFEEVRTIKKIDEMSVPIASKASSAGILMTVSEEQEARAYYAGYGESVTTKLFRPSTINDATQEIKGESSFDMRKVLRRFEKVVALHERFESRYVGVKIDDIPSKDLEIFLETHPMAQYVVNTEGKFGEVHKKVTRLFYIAEQELKALTQRVERLVKQITRKQTGVSIVKGYLGRRADLETFINSMTGKLGPLRSVAVSFDMAEFSKKFPMSLVRAYGTILKEITGEGYLDRIDLFFRSAKVMYSNRGFYDHLRGARGGFEGFLNFTWSSIHAAIMEVSLEVTGVQGELATFSDDGLLLFYPKSTEPDERIAGLIERIRDTYSELGLTFHLGKTLISDHMWEYLGDVCYNNRLIPMWVKELVKMGRVTSTRGFNPFYDRIKVVNSQSSAMIISSGDPLTSYVIKRYICGRMIRKWYPEVDSLSEESLLRIPTTCGGFRITSPFEDCIIQTIPTDSEVYADILLLDNINIGSAQKITASILLRTPFFRETKSEIRRCITSPTIFKTDLPDSSGASVLRWLLERIKSNANYKIPEDPLSDSKIQEVYDSLTRAKNIDLGSIGLLLSSVPGLSDYRSHIGVLKGNGALRLAKRSDLRFAQSKDTRNIKMCINFWDNVMKSPTPALNVFFIEECIVRNYPYINLSKMRLSARVVLQRTENSEKSNLEVTFKHGGGNDIYSSEYREPTLKVPSDPTTLAWHSESTGDNSTRDIRKMLSATQSIIAQNPNCENTIREICDIFGCRPPSTLAGIVRGAHRHRKSEFRSVDSRIILPRYHMSKVSFRHLNELSLYLNRKTRADRTTYGCAAEVMSYFLDSFYIKIKGPIPMSDERYYYTIDRQIFDACFETREMSDTDDTKVIPLDSPLPPNVKSEYIAYMEEVKNQVEQREIIDLAESLSSDGLDERANMIIGGIIKVIENYIVSASSMTDSTLLREIEIPRIAYLRTYILRRAIIGASLTILNPVTRTKLSRQINEIRTRSYNENSVETNEFKEFLALVERNYELLPSSLRAMTVRVGSEDYYDNRRDFMNIVTSEIFNYSLLSSSKIVVFFSKGFSSSDFSAEHKIAYRKIFRETISSLYTEYRSCKWDQEILKNKFPTFANLNIDESIDILKISYNIIRSSRHRHLPYNPRSAIILLKRFYYLITIIIKYVDESYDMVRRKKRIPKDEIFAIYRDWEPSYEEREEILNIGFVPGEDMVRNISRSIENSVLWRAIYYVSNYFKHDQLPLAINDDLTVDVGEIISIQTSFNETLVATARSKVKSYNHGLSSYIGREFINLTRSLSPIASIRSDTAKITGVDYFDSYMERDRVDLVMNHLEIIAISYGMLGFKCDSSIVGTLADRVKSRYGLELTYNVPTVGTIKSGASFKVFDIKCSNIGKALSTYVYLSNAKMSSISIIKENAPDEIILEEKGYKPTLDDLSEEDSDDEGESTETKGSEKGIAVNASGEKVLKEEIGNELEGMGVLPVSFHKVPDDDSDESTFSFPSDNNDDEESVLSKQKEKNEVYRVIGVTSLSDIEVDNSINPAVSSGLTDTLTEMIDNVSLADSLRETETILSSLSSSTRRSHAGDMTAFNVMRVSNLYTTGRQVNNISATLQAAVDLSKTRSDLKTQIASYSLFYCFLMGYRTKQTIFAAISKVKSELLRNSITVGTDIAAVNRWLNSSDITSGPNIETRAVSRVKRFALDKTGNIKGTPQGSAISYKMKTFDEAKVYADAIRNIPIGSLMEAVYYDEVEYYEEELEIEEVHTFDDDGYESDEF